MADDGKRSLVRRWEDLEFGVQVALAYPVLVVLVSVLHWTALAQPFMRGFIYGLFWALPATFLVAVASQNERRKRRERERAESGSDA
ncbi:MAG: hypothetical protein ACO3KD_02550 [Gaiellales bacterium]|jgi:hypothetical protein